MWGVRCLGLDGDGMRLLLPIKRYSPIHLNFSLWLKTESAKLKGRESVQINCDLV